MVISSTSALEVSIHAVSPELSGSGGAFAASAGVARASAASPPNPASATRFQFTMFILCSPDAKFRNCPKFPMPLKRVVVGLAGADAHDLLESGDEDLAVAHLAGFRFGGDRLDHGLRHRRFHRDLDLDLGQEAHGVFRAAVDFRVALLAAEALDLGDGHALDAKRRQRFAHLIQPERLDDRGDQLHRLMPSKSPLTPYQELCRAAANCKALELLGYFLECECERPPSAYDLGNFRQSHKTSAPRMRHLHCNLRLIIYPARSVLQGRTSARPGGGVSDAERNNDQAFVDG